MNPRVLYGVPLCFLFAYAMLTTFFLWRSEGKLEEANQEIVGLIIQLELAKNENIRAKLEIERQNKAIADHAASVEKAKKEYKAEINRINMIKEKNQTEVSNILQKDNSAENQLSLIKEQLQDYLVSPIEGTDGNTTY